MGVDYLADVNADGRTDFVHVSKEGVFYVYLSSGRSFENARVIIPPAPAPYPKIPESTLPPTADFHPGYIDTFGGVPYKWQLMDFDGDGRAEEFVWFEFYNAGANINSPLLTAEIKVIKLDIANSTASSIATYPVGKYESADFVWLVDVNGDRKPDLVKMIGRAVSVSLFKGDGFEPESTILTEDNFYDYLRSQGLQLGLDASSLVTFGDVNGDGLTDLITTTTSAQKAYYSRGNNFSSTGSDLTMISDGFFTAGDINGDGRSDFLYVSTYASQVSASFWDVGKSDLVTQISGSYGQSTGINYSAASSVGAVIGGCVCLYPYIPNTSPDYVVTSLAKNYGGGLTDSTSYKYSNSMFYNGTADVRTGLGFESIQQTSGNSGFYDITTYNQSLTYNGTVRQAQSFNQAATMLKSTDISYEEANPYGDVTIYVRQKGISQNSYDPSTGNLLVNKFTSFSYDNFGNPVSVSELISGNTGASRALVSVISYSNDIPNWILGRVTEVTKSSNGTVIERTQMSYDAKNLTSVSKFLGGGRWNTTSYSYDSFGNVITTTDALGRTISVEYDTTVHNYTTKVTNAKGQVSTSQYDTTTGNVTSTTDVSGIVTTKKYDGYGRLSTVDSGSYHEEYVYSNTGDPTSQYVEKRINDGSKDGYIWTRNWTDGLGRTVKKESKAFKVSTTTEITEYDILGRVKRKSGPYLSGVETPPFTIYEYNDPAGRVTKATNPEGTSNTVSYNGLNVTTTDAKGLTHTTVKNELGQTVSKSDENISTNYGYDEAGRLIVIQSPSGLTQFSFDLSGKKLTQSDSNSGTTSYNYDNLGNLISTTDARGMTVNFSYDELNRLATVRKPEGATNYTYDENGYTGKLTTVTDETGKTVFQYSNTNGLVTQKTQSVDDLNFTFKYEYDIMNRVNRLTYPDGSAINRLYADSGHLTALTMDSSDGNSKNWNIVSYTGPTLNGSIIRETGNGVKTEIYYDSATQRPTEYYTKTPTGKILEDIVFGYDALGNITLLTNKIYSERSQTFQFDNLNRLVQANGKYGTIEYGYSNSGNLIKKGDVTLSYNGNRVTSLIPSPVLTLEGSLTGEGQAPISYAYDASGNMIDRNGDQLTYDSVGKLRMIQTSDGRQLTYGYDFTGNRVKQASSNGTLVYNADGLFEVTRRPGCGDLMTSYVVGLKGDRVSQMTQAGSTVASLTPAPLPPNTEREGYAFQWLGLTSNTRSNPTLKRGVERSILHSLRDWKNKQLYSFLLHYNEIMFKYRVTLILVAIATALLLGLYFGLNHAQNGKKFPHPGLAVVAESADIPPLHSLRKWRGVTNAPFVPNVEVWGEGNIHPVFRFVSPLLILSVLVTFSFSTCFGLGDSGSKGDAPWALLASGIGQGTPSVASTGSATGTSSTGTSTGSVSGPSGNTGSTTTPSSNCNQTANGQPVTGMFFLHPDHLGSITMITDTKGNPITGDVGTGASHIAYKPYGEIDRQNSDGPDITRFKYTGQTEDSESSLMYYKARYYDPKLGVFLSPDAVVQPMSPNGMNRYAYVSGNPVNYRDSTGNWLNWHMFGQIISAIQGGIAWAGTNIGNAASAAGTNVGNAAAVAGTNVGNAAKVAGTNIGNTATWMSTGLKNAANSYNHITGQEKHKGSAWERSDIGNYDFANRLGLGKASRWWNRAKPGPEKSREQYSNTSNAAQRKTVQYYAQSDVCIQNNGQSFCNALLWVNAGVEQNERNQFQHTKDPFNGFHGITITDIQNYTNNGDEDTFSFSVEQAKEVVAFIWIFTHQSPTPDTN